MTSSSEQPPNDQKQIFWNEAKPEDFMHANKGDWIQYVGDISTDYEVTFIRNFGGWWRSRPHPAPTRTAEHMQSAYAHGVMDGARKAREDLLNRLDKEIATRENEMHRKGNLEDNLTTATGYLTAAGALNWVRVVLIDGSRDTIDGDALRTTPPHTEQDIIPNPDKLQHFPFKHSEQEGRAG